MRREDGEVTSADPRKAGSDSLLLSTDAGRWSEAPRGIYIDNMALVGNSSKELAAALEGASRQKPVAESKHQYHQL